MRQRVEVEATATTPIVVSAPRTKKGKWRNDGKANGGDTGRHAEINSLKNNTKT